MEVKREFQNKITERKGNRLLRYSLLQINIIKVSMWRAFWWEENGYHILQVLVKRTVVVSEKRLGLWTDGRYFIQEKQFSVVKYQTFKMGSSEFLLYIYAAALCAMRSSHQTTRVTARQRFGCAKQKACHAGSVVN